MKPWTPHPHPLPYPLREAVAQHLTQRPRERVGKYEWWHRSIIGTKCPTSGLTLQMAVADSFRGPESQGFTVDYHDGPYPMRENVIFLYVEYIPLDSQANGWTKTPPESLR